MDALRKFEITIAGWYKGLPRLPKELTKWLANNAWWIVIIGVAISVFALFAVIPLAFAAVGLSTVAVSQVGVPYGAAVTSVVSVSWFGILISIVHLVIVTLLELFAINPLKAKEKKGWSLLFAAALVSAVFGVVLPLLAMNLLGAIFGLFWTAVGLYVLFEIRSYFDAKVQKPVAKSKTVKAAAK